MPTSFQMLEHEMRDRLAAKNVEIDCLRAERDALREALADLLRWYETLPKGWHYPEQINDWLGSSSLKTALAKARAARDHSQGGEG